jgi:hypothetical protein
MRKIVLVKIIFDKPLLKKIKHENKRKNIIKSKKII